MVYSIKDTSEKEMAIKICIKETDYHDKPQVEFLGALKQASLDNPFIVPIKGIFQYRGALKTGLKTVEVGKRNAILLIVMPYFKTNLDNIFLKKPKYLLKIFLDVALGLQYLHSKKIYHRDIKPANILITKDIYSKTFRAVICDFSLAAIEQVLPNTYSNKYKANEKQLKNAKSEKKLKRQQQYWPKEVCQKLDFSWAQVKEAGYLDDHKWDAYSFGKLIKTILAKHGITIDKNITKEKVLKIEPKQRLFDVNYDAFFYQLLLQARTFRKARDDFTAIINELINLTPPKVKKPISNVLSSYAAGKLALF